MGGVRRMEGVGEVGILSGYDPDTNTTIIIFSLHTTASWPSVLIIINHLPFLFPFMFVFLCTLRVCVCVCVCYLFTFCRHGMQK